jgi:hypothetical protein
MQCVAVDSVNSISWELLQLPDAAPSLVLQKLDQCSLACAAVTCSKLSHAVPANTSKLDVHCRTSDGLNSMLIWLERHSNSLTSLELCSTAPYRWAAEVELQGLSCPQLRQLCLDRISWQLEPADGCPGVLHGCTGLTALDVSTSGGRNAPATAAAIAALTDLRSLQLVLGNDLQSNMQCPTQLTRLSLEWPGGLGPTGAARLSQLSGLVNLEHLRLSQLPCDGVPGGVPSQLTKLTRLHLAYRMRIDDWDYDGQREERDPAAQFQALSSLRALRELYVSSDENRPTEGLSGVQQLPLLTSLELRIPGLKFSSKYSWVRSLTALEELRLKSCKIEAEAVARHTQLQLVSLDECDHPARLKDVLNAMSQLTLLTQLRVKTTGLGSGRDLHAAAFTALTASTNLCTLQLSLYPADMPRIWTLFRPGSQAVYPHLRVIDLTFANVIGSPGKHFSKQQLQQLCSCCPVVERLHFVLPAQPSPTALLPLLQLSAMTSLGAHHVDAAAVGVAAQLTGLRELQLREFRSWQIHHCCSSRP